jgi:hypothetical protein
MNLHILGKQALETNEASIFSNISSISLDQSSSQIAASSNSSTLFEDQDNNDNNHQGQLERQE